MRKKFNSVCTYILPGPPRPLANVEIDFRHRAQPAAGGSRSPRGVSPLA
jgi:hypothetical protein